MTAQRPWPRLERRRRRHLNEEKELIVVCGEALFDVFATGETPTGLMLDARVGGSPFNVAVGLARLAQPVAFLSHISRGFLGERLMRALAAEGVETATVQRSDAPTTLSLVGVDACGVPSYAFYGEDGADRRLSPEALALLPAGARALHFGSYAAVVGPTAATQRMLIEREHARKLITYDPNVRLNVEPRLEVWREHLAWMLPRTHLLKVSDEDLGLLFPGAAPADLAAAWCAAGVSLVVVTRGGKGAEAWTASSYVRVPSRPVDVVDTVGAGDTFQAAQLTWLAEHDRLAPDALRTWRPDELEAMLHFAGRAAAITCSRRGADLPRRGEID